MSSSRANRRRLEWNPHSPGYHRNRSQARNHRSGRSCHPAQ
jgi:hypothetical protein